MITTILAILAAIGVVLLFLAAFNFNFKHVSSGWMGLALINLSLVFPLLHLPIGVLLAIVAVLLVILILLIVSRRPLI